MQLKGKKRKAKNEDTGTLASTHFQFVRDFYAFVAMGRFQLDVAPPDCSEANFFPQYQPLAM